MNKRLKKCHLTMQQIDDICWYHNFINGLPEHWRPYYEWWIWEVSHGTIKLEPRKETTYVEEEVWTPPELRNTQDHEIDE